MGAGSLSARLPRLAWLVAGFGLLTAALLAPALLYLRGEALRSAQERTEALSQVIAEQAARTLQAVDSRLQLVISGLEVLRTAGELDEGTARHMFTTQLKDLPFVRGIWVTDARGRVVLDSGSGNVGRSVADRGYVRQYQREPATGLFVGPPTRSRATGQWMISLSRPLRDAAGNVTGVVTAAVEPTYFEHMWQRFDLGEHGAVVLLDRSGNQLMRSPLDDASRGENFARTPLFTRHLAAAPAGVFTGRSPVDGVRRIIAYRVLPAYPQLTVTVGSAVGEALAPWRRLATLTALLWLAALLAAAGLAVQLHRQSRRREETERRFRQLAQAMPQIVFVADAPGALRFVNQRWTEYTGLPAERALGAGWQELLHPEDRERTPALLQERITSGAAEVEHAMRLRNRQGAWRWQLLRAVRFREQGQEWWYGTATDIHELLEAQARLQEQAGLLKLAGRLARLGGWRVDLANGRVRFSEEAAAILDLPPEAEPTMQEVAAMFTPRAMAGSMEALQDCVERGVPFDVEVEMRTPAGRLVWLRSIGQPVRDAKGRVTAIQGAQQDITQRVHMVQEIRELNTGLEEKVAQRTRQLVANEAALRLANAQLESFAYSVSHDLQSPLQRIQSFARLLQEELAGTAADRAQHYLARIRANAETMAQLIEGLLALAYVSEVDMIRSAVNLSDMATEILQRLEADQPQRQVRWRVQPGLAAMGDVRLLRSVLENLVGNAWKFTGGREEAEIVVGAEDGAFFVRDNGAGFDMAYAHRLFGTFQRLHDPEEFPGTGMGLATVARAVSRHGGRIWAEAAPGQGATFHFTIPS